VTSVVPVLGSSWAPPAPTQAPVQPVRRVATKDCWAAAYPPFVITLAVCGIVATVQTYLPVALLAAAPFLFVPRVRFRVAHLRYVNFGILGVLALLWVISLVVNSSMYNTDLNLSVWVMIGCWGLGLADLFLQWLGLRNGERPNHT